MKRPQLVSRGALERMLQAAEEAWSKKDFSKNIELLKSANRMAPANVGILLQLGRVHGLCYDYANAERWFEQALRVAPHKLEALVAAGINSRDFRRSSLAEGYFERAVAEPGAPPEAFVQLAEFYERTRRVDDAGKLIDRALALNPRLAMALLARARLERQAGRLQTAEAAARACLTVPDREMQIRGGYELGLILDREGRYDDAFRAFLAAKALLAPEAAAHAPRLRMIRERLTVMKETITADMLKRWTAAAAELPASRRIALLCGHPRSGTTLLEQVLDSHPDIVSAEETETFHDYAYCPLIAGAPESAYMPAVLESATIPALRKSREDYFRVMELVLGQPIGGRLLIDKNPSLTFLIPAMARVFPEIKLLVALRDPRDVCLSCFMQPFFPLSQTASAYLTISGTVEEYAALMSVWLKLAPLLADRFLEIRYEELVDNLEGASRRVTDYLGIAWDPKVLRFDEHARQKTVRSPTYSDVTKPVFKTAVGRWKHYEKYLAPHLNTLAPFARAFGYE